MIKVHDLHFSYPGNPSETLLGLNFDVCDGEVFGFLGPSGAGKSTTQKLLIGILRKYSGSITVNNVDLGVLTSDFYEHIGVAFETPNLYSKFTALENLTFFSQFYTATTRNAEDLLETVGLLDARDTRVSEFSKGMKVRLNFCRSLLNNPKLLFLDEPTSGLDPVNLRKVMDLIRTEQAQGTTVCITTHDMHVADGLCDRVAFIVDGQIKLIDSPRELKLQHGERCIDVEYQGPDGLQKITFLMDGLAKNSEFQNVLKSESLETLHSREASLEDVFVKTTGRQLQ